MSAGDGNKAVIAALLANLGIAVTKLVAFALTRSSSMLAEAIHSFADSGNQVLLLVGGRRAKREATELHQFGYGRERYVYSFVVSIVLFSVGGLFALYEGWHKVHDPHAIEHWHWVPVAVLLLSIVLAVEMKSLLIGESATREAQRRIEAAITGAPGVERLIHIKTLHVGPEEVLVAAKFGVAPTDVAADVAAAIDAAERAVRAAEP